MLLPTKEYAELCHAIQTKCGNKTSEEDFILYGNYFYMYTYNETLHKIDFVGKVEIEGNRDEISLIMGRYRNGKSAK